MGPPRRTYAPRIVDPLGPPPSKLEGVRSYFFELEATEANLAALVDAQLNAPLCPETAGEPPCPPPRTFTPSGDRVILAFSHFERAYSASYKDAGSVEYLEVALMVNVLIERPGRKPESALFIPALFLDGPGAARSGERDASGDTSAALYPIATGRELYGLPKTRARVTLDVNGLEDWGAVDVFDVECRECGEPPPLVKLLSLISVSAELPDAAGPEDGDAGSGGRRLTLEERKARAARMLGVAPDDIRPEADGSKWVSRSLGVEVDLRHPYAGSRRLLGLRQFRHPVEYHKTDAQQVVATSYTLDDDPQALRRKFEISFSDTKHVKLRDALGLRARYEVGSDRGAVYEGASACFGDPAATEIWESEGAATKGR